MRSLLEITNKKMWEEYTDPEARRIAEKVYRPIMLVPLIYLVGCAVMSSRGTVPSGDPSSASTACRSFCPASSRESR